MNLDRKASVIINDTPPHMKPMALINYKLCDYEQVSRSFLVGILMLPTKIASVLSTKIAQKLTLILPVTEKLFGTRKSWVNTPFFLFESLIILASQVN